MRTQTDEREREIEAGVEVERNPKKNPVREIEKVTLVETCKKEPASL